MECKTNIKISVSDLYAKLCCHILYLLILPTKFYKVLHSII